MQAVQTIIEILSAVFSVWMMLLLIYQLVLSIFGFTRKTKDYKDHDPQSRFLILVPAHNEEKVIGDIIENLRHMEYPGELYDFYIIADNCTDRTADVARQMGANVIETFKDGPDGPTGKPIALKKALDQLGDYQVRYDLMMIFDADNLIDPNMLLEVNSQYLDKGKPELIQCYLGAKNKKGVIAWFYYTSYTITNRFFQLAKCSRGLNCSIGGTGFAMSTQYLYERGGWTTMSLTEDFEIQVQATLEGKRILWNHNVRVYDEKPTRMRASLRQRIRWAQGHWFVCFRNTGKVLRAVLSRRISFREGLSIFTYMYSLSPYIVIVLQIILSVVSMALDLGSAPAAFNWYTNIPGVLLFGYSYLMLFYLADWWDNRISFRWNTLPRFLASIVVSMAIAVVSQWAGLFLHRRQNQWVKTDHCLHNLEGDHSHLSGNPPLLSEAASHQE